MILTSSFLTVQNKHAFVTARNKFRFTNIIKRFYDDHAEITGTFMILKNVAIYLNEF
jgi:hypothetical protein